MLLALAAHAAPGRAEPGLLVVAWDEAGAGRVAGLDLAPPFGFRTPALDVDADGRVRTGFGRVLHLSRATGALRLIDPATWSVVLGVPIPAALAPRDVAWVSPTRAYVTCAGSASLLRVDLESGDVEPAVDLSPLGVGDGNPVMESIAHHEGRLYVQLAGPSAFPPEPHFLAVVDVASEQLVDADPDSPGPQAIALQGTAPRFKMQVAPGTRRLVVSATGDLNPDGGLELVDLDSLQSLGVPIREFQGANGNDIGAFVMLDADRGWLVFATDIVLSSHLHPFTLSAGTEVFEAATSLFYFAPHLVHDAAGHRLYWPEPGGVRAFDAETGAPLAALPTPLPGDPTDLALLPALPAPVPAVGGIGYGLLVAALALARRWSTQTTRCAPPAPRRPAGGSPA
jgi:hypothetical protein